MVPLRLLVTFASTILLLILLLYLALASHSQHYSRTHQTDDKSGSLRDFFYFRSPGSLFSPSATISLTDDNSTFFAARPAAFGPLVPSKGLSGQIWIGNGFGGNTLGNRGLLASLEGELGCNDVPGWINGHTSNEKWVEKHSRLSSPPLSSALQGNHSELYGKIALLTRGGCSFSDKVKWAQRRGASAVIIGDNIQSGPLVRMYAHGDTSNVTIASLFTSHTAAQLLSSLVPTHAEDHVSATAIDNVVEDEIQERHDAAEAINVNMHEDLSPYASVSSSKHDTSSGTRTRNGPVTVQNAAEASPFRNGLWVTLTLSGVSTSPFFNTLFVLVVSPLITLAIVYTMLLIRSRIRQRRWRAPKSIVDQLPVRIYRALSGQSSPVRNEQNADSRCDERTALLASSGPPTSSPRSCSRSSHGITDHGFTPSQYGSLRSLQQTEQEKADDAIPGWQPKPRIKQIECAVCLEEYVDGISKIMSLPCGHEFHADCVTPWLTTRRRTCPICKGDVVRSLGQNTTSPDNRGSTHSSAEDEFYDDRESEPSSVTATSALLIPQDRRDRLIQADRGQSSHSNPETSRDSIAQLSRQSRRSLRMLQSEPHGRPQRHRERQEESPR